MRLVQSTCGALCTSSSLLIHAPCWVVSVQLGQLLVCADLRLSCAVMR